MKTYTVFLCALMGLAQQGYCDMVFEGLFDAPHIEMIQQGSFEMTTRDKGLGPQDVAFDDEFGYTDLPEAEPT